MDLLGPVDVILFPPDDDDNSDEDSEDEEDNLPKDPNHLGRGILSQQAEIILYNNDDMADELPDIPETARAREVQDEQDEEDEEDEEDKEREEDNENHGEKKLGRTKNTDRKFKKTKNNIFGMSVPDLEEQPLKTLPDGCDTPYDFFKLFVTDKFVDETVEKSRLYAARKGNSHILPKLTHNNIRISHAIMYMTGYITPSNRRMYWEKREDSRNNMVARTMSESTFTGILRNTTFVATTVADPKDRF